MTVLVDFDPRNLDTILHAVGPNTRVLTSLDALDHYLLENRHEYVVVLAPSVGVSAAFDLAERMRIERPALGVILVQELVDATLLTDALRSGIREVVSRHDLGGLTKAVQRANEIADRIREREFGPDRQPPPPSDGEHEPGKVITVFSAKGGCGKTTLATNLAAALAERGDREICVLDLDLSFGDVAIAMQLYPTHTIADAVSMNSLDEFGLRGLVTVHSPGVAVLAAPMEPGGAENIPAPVISGVVNNLRRMFDAVIIDTPAAFSDQVLAAFDLTDMFLLISTLDIPALKNLKLTLETMDLLNYPRDRWRIVLNRADSKVGLTVSEVEKTLRLPISTQIPSSRAVPMSINRGVPLVQEDPGHPVSVEIRRFADRIVSVSSPEPATGATERRGLLRRKARNS
ncbi:MAG TPA: P-loop NTPase [Actinomycetes bacterium]|nr:P-loop NTPase [Actinomycetes bacterium]